MEVVMCQIGEMTDPNTLTELITWNIADYHGDICNDQNVRKDLLCVRKVSVVPPRDFIKYHKWKITCLSGFPVRIRLVGWYFGQNDQKLHEIYKINIYVSK